ncbi:MAG: hypothetical protein ACKVPX_18560 [Myxococcaceae bacterium]
MKDVYIVATESAKPVRYADFQEALEAEEGAFQPGMGKEWSFRLTSSDADIHVEFESREALGWSPDLLTGSADAHAVLRKARGFYRIAFEPGKPQPTAAVFEALWCARALLEKSTGVLVDTMAYRLHELSDVVDITELEFDIRDHINLHAVEVIEGETPLWVHSHGMEKFATRDVEVFHLSEDDLLPAESFLHELCTDMAFGQGPQARTVMETSNSQSFMLVPSEEARPTLMGVALDSFEGHEGLFFTVTSGEGRHMVSELLKPYRSRFEEEEPEEAAAHMERARRLMPSFKARFQRRGWMEPITFLVRATFETNPGEAPVNEDLWLEVLSWEEQQLVGKLVDGSSHTTEWRKGAAVEVSEGEINAISLGRDGKAVDEAELQRLLSAERPS